MVHEYRLAFVSHKNTDLFGIMSNLATFKYGVTRTPWAVDIEKSEKLAFWHSIVSKQLVTDLQMNVDQVDLIELFHLVPKVFLNFNY